MTRYFHIVWLLLVTVSVAAQPRSLQVRLFWQHPPSRIQIVPDQASIRTCATCAPKSLTSTLGVTGQGSNVVAGGISYSSLMLNGRARVTGEDFSTFKTNGELLIQSRDGFLLLTLTMTLEQYVTAVLQGESAGFKSDEALKAMAVAARTYAVYFGSRHRLEGFDFCDTTHCQDVRLGNESPRARAAVAATDGELLWFEGRPAATYYHRSCGGEIEDASELDPDLHAPYLRPHHDDYCLRTPDEWNSEISKPDLVRALGRQLSTVAVAARSNSGRVQTLLVDNARMSATDFRLAIGRTLGWDKLRSDLYQFEDRGDRISFRGRGQGHGVGLCQTGADNMGEQGHTYREILAFYYPGTALGLNAQGLSWETLPGESLDLVTTHREDATVLLPSAERALRFSSQQTGWNLNFRPQVRVYPTIPVYRDATGAPGWVAASTLGHVIRLQPVSTLQGANVLELTLRHEFLHLLIESRASPGTPLWLREGLAVYLTNPASGKAKEVDVAALERRLHSLQSEDDMRAAYRDSAAAVAEAVAKNGLGAVLSWLNTMK
jgi:stage II sporulation protein D